MIYSKNLVPDVYNTSHDFTIFEAFIDAIFNKSDVNSKNLLNLHSPENCLEENLQKLSNFFNLQTSDRNLIKYYRSMTKSKGTKSIIDTAIEVCGAVVKDCNIIDITNNNCQIIYDVELTANFKINLFNILKRRLLEFNCQLQLHPI